MRELKFVRCGAVIYNADGSRWEGHKAASINAAKRASRALQNDDGKNGDGFLRVGSEHLKRRTS